MKYCSYCGKELNENKTCPCVQEKEVPKVSSDKKNVKKVASLASIIVVALVILIYFISRITSTVNLGDYISVENITGLNGQGMISYSFDEKGLMLALFGEGKGVELTSDNVDKIIKANLEKYEEFKNLMDSITLTATPRVNLSNGDKVKIIAEFENSGNHSFKYHIKSGSISYTVKGLADGKPFDPFSDEIVSVTFEGINGKASAKHEIKVSNELRNHINYSFSKAHNLSNGDEIILTVSFDAKELESLGYYTPEQTEKTYTVTSLPEYASSATEIPASILSELKNTAMEKATTTAKQMDADGYSIVNEPEYVETFFVKVKDSTASHKDIWYGLDMNNGILVMTHVTLLNDFYEKTYEYWYTYLFPDWYISESEGLRYDENSIVEMRKIFDSETEARQWVNDDFGDMNITAIG